MVGARGRRDASRVLRAGRAPRRVRTAPEASRTSQIGLRDEQDRSIIFLNPLEIRCHDTCVGPREPYARSPRSPFNVRCLAGCCGATMFSATRLVQDKLPGGSGLDQGEAAEAVVNSGIFLCLSLYWHHG